MANMTQAQFVTELKVRGWDRFADAELQRYLDWALQDLHGKFGYDRSLMQTYSDPVFATVSLPLATMSPGEGVREVSEIWAAQTADDRPSPVAPADEMRWHNLIRPNSIDSSPALAALPALYYVDALTIYFYPKPQSPCRLTVQYLLRKDAFSPADTGVSGLPERFDKALLAQTEWHCYRRANDTDGMSIAGSEVDRFLSEEMGMAGQTMAERVRRVEPWSA